MTLKRQKKDKSFCAPHKEDDSVSCFDKDTLINMIKNHNKKNKGNKILGNVSLRIKKRKIDVNYGMHYTRLLKKIVMMKDVGEIPILKI